MTTVIKQAEQYGIGTTVRVKEGITTLQGAVGIISEHRHPILEADYVVQFEVGLADKIIELGYDHDELEPVKMTTPTVRQQAERYAGKLHTVTTTLTDILNYAVKPFHDRSEAAGRLGFIAGLAKTALDRTNGNGVEP